MLKAQSSWCHTNNLPPVELGCCAGAQIPYFLTLRRNVPQQCEANCRCVSQPPHLQTLTHTHTNTLSQLHSLVTMWNTTQISHLITKNVRRSFFRWCNMLLQRCNDSSLSRNACAKSMAEKSKWCCFVYGEVEEKIAQQPHLSVFYVTFSYDKSMTTKFTDEETLKTKK